MCECVRACMHVRECVCTRRVRDVFAIYDNNISPRLIMIISKSIIFHTNQPN